MQLDLRMIAEALTVRLYEEGDTEAWENYVQSHPSATVFHRLAWSKAVQRAYGHRCLHLTAWTGARMSGVLPLFMVKSAFVGRVLVSVPYATYGGILADSDEVLRAILAAAADLCTRLKAQYLELRHRDANSLDLPEFGCYDTFRKELPRHPEEVLPSLPRKTRAAARKGIELLTTEFGPELLETIYDLYSLTLRRLGSPNYRKSLFQELRGVFGDDCVCLMVRDGGKPVAGVISYVFRDEIMPYFSGSLDEGMRKNANNVMYVKLMEYGAARGLRWFDFNRTRRDNRGPHAFKRNHGFQPTPLRYQVLLNKAKGLPNLSPGNRKFALASRVWQGLPLCVTRRAGAWITKWIP